MPRRMMERWNGRSQFRAGEWEERTYVEAVIVAAETVEE